MHEIHNGNKIHQSVGRIIIGHEGTALVHKLLKGDVANIIQKGKMHKHPMKKHKHTTN